MKKLMCVAVVALSVCGMARAGGGVVLFVDDDAKAGGDGASWATAYRTLQDALAAVRVGGVAAEVRVAQGVYRPDDGAGFVKGDREVSFALDVAVTVRGGYAGIGAVDPDARDVKGFVTTLSGDLAGDDAPSFGNRSENSKRVVVMSAASGEAVLEGMVVRGGENGEGTGNSAQPGGVHVASGLSSMRDCVITDNQGRIGGGVGVANSTNFTMKRCWVHNNKATYAGGGMGFTISWVNCIGLAESCRFSKNEAPQGGGLFGAGSSSTINWKLLNCVIDRNVAISDANWSIGGGLVWQSFRAPLVNCVVYENSAPEGSYGGLMDLSPYASSFNSVFWENSDKDGTWRWSQAFASLAFAGGTINAVEYITTPVETGNGAADRYFVQGDPHFVDPDGADNIAGNADDDFRLRPGSPLIDAGIVRSGVATYPVPSSGEDADGFPRVVDDPTRANSPAFPASTGAIDLGPFEFQYDCNSNGTVDSVDLQQSPSWDCDHNGMLDQCESTTDCNANGVNDRCEIATGAVQDCNGNGLPDSCDIISGASEDQDVDGIPDECQLRIVRVAHAEALADAGMGAWTDSVPSLHTALAIAADRPGSTEIWIAAGVYKPDGVGGRRNALFQVPPHTAIYGGFHGTETDRDEREVYAGETVLSGDLNGDDDPGTEIGQATTQPDRDDNSLVLMRVRGPSVGVVIDGVVFENAEPDGPPLPRPVRPGSSDRGEVSGGGGVSVGVEADARVVSCEFRRCSHGALSTGYGKAEIERCWFHDNAASAAAAAFVGAGSSVIDCTFEGNVGRGSALGGGAVSVDYLGPSDICKFERCKFVGNTMSGDGGAVMAYVNKGVVFASCLFAGNSATGVGGAVTYRQLTLTTPPGSDRGINIHSCTFAGNTAGETHSGAVASASVSASRVKMSNTVMFGNRAAGASSALFHQLNFFDSNEPGIAANCIEGVSGAGFGNIGLDPMFVDADGPDDVYGTEDDDIRLMPGSPCIDAGNNDVLPEVIQAPVMLDLLGGARFVDDPSTPDTGVGIAPIIDIGAVEFVPAPPPACAGDVNGDGLTDGRDLSVLLAGFGTAVTPGIGADFNGDGLVDGRDLSVLLAGFGCG